MIVTQIGAMGTILRARSVLRIRSSGINFRRPLWICLVAQSTLLSFDMNVSEERK